MKRSVITLCLLISFRAAIAPNPYELLLYRPAPIMDRGNPTQWLKAIIWTESSIYGSRAYNPDEPAAGILQEWPILVDDVNAILGAIKYSYEDRLIPEKAIEMFWIYQQRYNPEMNFEKMCRIWCGGPKGYMKDCTINYFNTVRDRLFSI